MFQLIKWKVVFAIIPALLTVVPCNASDELKRRMLERAEEIVQLTESKKAIEGRDGFLKALSADTLVVQTVQEENADRQLVYEVIAKKTGNTAELVGQRRALQICRRDCEGTGNCIKCLPENIAAKIIAKCKSDWPDDFVMQKHCRARQSNAWLDMN